MLRVIYLSMLLGLLSTAANAAPDSPAVATSLPSTFPATSSAVGTTTSTTNSSTLATTPLDTHTITNIVGPKGQLDEQTQTYKITLPRKDLNILLNGVKLTPAMGLSSWVTFKKTQGTTTLKADVVVTENQANTILSLALDNNLAPVALHNHLLWESPRVMFIHLEGVGDEKALALAIKKVFDKTLDTDDEASDFPLAAIDPADTTLDPRQIDNILGTTGLVKEGNYTIHVSCTATAEQDKQDPSKIINANATFAGSDKEAVVDGDISLRASDLHSVLKSLHDSGIAIVALHQHESNNNETRMVYLHYFGVGSARTLAKGLHGALEAAKAHDIALATPSITLLKSSTTAANHASPVALVKTPAPVIATNSNAPAIKTTAATLTESLKTQFNVAASSTAHAFITSPVAVTDSQPNAFITPSLTALTQTYAYDKFAPQALVSVDSNKKIAATSTAEQPKQNISTAPTAPIKMAQTASSDHTTSHAIAHTDADNKTATVTTAKQTKNAVPAVATAPLKMAQTNAFDQTKLHASDHTDANKKGAAIKSAQQTKKVRPVTIATAPIKLAKTSSLDNSTPHLIQHMNNNSIAIHTKAQTLTPVVATNAIKHSPKVLAKKAQSTSTTSHTKNIAKAAHPIKRHGVTSLAQAIKTHSSPTTYSSKTERKIALVKKKPPHIAQIRSPLTSKQIAEASAQAAARRIAVASAQSFGDGRDNEE